MSFAAVEERLNDVPVPEPVQERIVFWSFPRDETQIRRYAGKNFEAAENIVRKSQVKDPLQIGKKVLKLLNSRINKRALNR